MPYTPYSFSPWDAGQYDPNANPFPQMRQKSIFDKPTTPEDNTKRFLSQVNPPPRANFSQPDTSPDPTDEGGKYFDAMRKMQRQGPAVSAYQAALKEQPTDDNTEVSTGRKIMGTLAGIAGGFAKGPEAGISSANEIIDSPYKTAMRDYTVKMKNLGESAKLEQDDQTAQLNAMAKAREFGLTYDKYKSQLANEQFERGIKEGNLDVARRGATAAETRATTGITDADTRRKAMLNTGSKNVQDIARDEERTRLMGRDTATRERQAATGAAAQADTAAYHKGMLDIRGKEGKKVTPSQQNYALDVAYRQLASDPAYADFVKKDDKGFFDVKPEKVDANSLTYQSFTRRLKILAEAAIKKGTPYDDVPDTMDDDLVTIGKPRGK